MALAVLAACGLTFAAERIEVRRPATPNASAGIQDGPDSILPVVVEEVIRVHVPPFVMEAPDGEVVRVAVAPAILSTRTVACDDANNCTGTVQAACYDSIGDCRQRTDETCAGLGGSAAGERLTTCNIEGNVVSCCEMTCVVGGAVVVATCSAS